MDTTGGELYARIVEGFHDAVFVFDASARVTFVNAAAAALFQRPADQIVGQTAEMLFPPEFASRHDQRIREVFETGESFEGEVETAFPAGRVWQHVSLAPLFGKDGAVEGVYGLTSDITARKLAEVTLRESEGLYRALVEAVGDIVFVIDRDDRVQYLNEAAARWFGSTPEELVGRPRTDLFSGEAEWARRQTDTLRRVFERGEPLYIEDEAEFPEGKRWQGTSLEPVRDDDGEIVAVMGLGRDITEHKQAEAALNAANAELNDRLLAIGRISSQMAALNRLGQLLQGCRNENEAYKAFGSLSAALFPGTSGALAVRDESGLMVEVVEEWGWERDRFEKVFRPDDCWAIRLGSPFLAQPAGIRSEHIDLVGLDSALCAPLAADGESLGVLSLVADETVDLRDEMLRQHVISVCEQTAMSLAGLRLRRQLEEQAVRDSLTGLYNRRFLEESLRRECHRAARAQGTLALILLDVDRLKGFNDGFGHAAGDAVLRACADAMTGCTRAEDAVCRVGGDEFVVMMPGASAADAVAKSEEIRVAIGGLTVLDAGRPVGPVTIS